MSERPIIIKSRPWLKRTILLVLWILFVLIFIIVARNNELNTLTNNALIHKSEIKPLKNEIRSLCYVKRDPKQNGRPIYHVYFKSFRADNNKLGIFKTGLHKAVKIQGLQLKFYRYTPSNASSATNPRGSKSAKTVTTDVSHIPKGIMADGKTLVGIVDRLAHPRDGWRINIDLSNVSEVRVNNFDYEEFQDGDLFFGVQSKRLMASTKQTGLLLRGHVTIKTADGSTLESNCAEWDTENQHFTVSGIYVLNRNGVKTIGKDICVDSQLNVLKRQQAKFERKEGERCLAKL